MSLVDKIIAVVEAIGAELKSKEPAVTAGTTDQYYRGDKTWQPLLAAALPDLYDLTQLYDDFDDAPVGWCGASHEGDNAPTGANNTVVLLTQQGGEDLTGVLVQFGYWIDSGEYGDMVLCFRMSMGGWSNWAIVTNQHALTDLDTTVTGEQLDEIKTTVDELGTAAGQDSGAFATAAQGTAADSAVQPGDLATVATSGSYTDLANKPVIPDVSGKEDTANRNAPNGYAGLDNNGTIYPSLLPSFVDDVLEFANLAAFPGTGDTGKIYTALDTNKVYRWSGSTYVEISASPGSTDSVPEGGANLYYTQSRADARVAAGITGKADKSTTITAGTGLSGGGDLSENRTLSVDYGTSSTTACVGNDGRLSNARTPTAHSHAAGDVNSGTFAIARIPTGTSSSTVCVGNDGRLSDARPPTSHSHGLADVPDALPRLAIVNSQTANYTLVLADADKTVEVLNAAARTVTVPTNASVAFPVGTVIEIVQCAAGQVTIAGAGGVSLSSPASLKTRAQWSSISIRKRGNDSWIVMGDLE